MFGYFHKSWRLENLQLGVELREKVRAILYKWENCCSDGDGPVACSLNNRAK